MSNGPTDRIVAFIAEVGIPILERLRPHSEIHGTQALVLVPTRELAMQVNDGLSPLVDAVGLPRAVGPRPPQQFADLIRTETDKVAKIVKDAGIKLE